MSSSNHRRNKAAIEQYRKELRLMLNDISDIDAKVMKRAANEGLKTAKQLTSVSKGGNVVEFTTRDGKHVRFTTRTSTVGGHMRKSWKVSRIRKSKNGVEQELFNTADYASYVNYGHRIVQGGKTKGWVPGQYILEKATSKVEKTLVREFNKEVERVNRKHDK